jgi:lambda family phage tail tape measure protein
MGKNMLSMLLQMIMQVVMLNIVFAIANVLTGGGFAGMMGAGGMGVGGLLSHGLGFAQGGYTGDGNPDEPAGIVHKGEVVFHQQSVRRLGVGFLENLRLGRTSPAMFGGEGMMAGPAFAGGGGGGGGEQHNSFALLYSESELRRFYQGARGEAYVLDVVRRNWHHLQRR